MNTNNIDEVLNAFNNISKEELENRYKTWLASKQEAQIVHAEWVQPEVSENLEAKKGGKGAGSAAPETPNTMQSRAILKLAILLGQGPVVGIPGTAGFGQGIYINDTPLQNADGTYNFRNTSYDFRIGTPTQAKIPGFTNAASPVDVGAPVTFTTPVVRSVSSANVDSVKIIISLPEGLITQDNGELKGSRVDLAVDRKLSSNSAWEFVSNIVLEGKTDSATEQEFMFERPSTPGVFDIRVRRLTADSTTTLRNATKVSGFVEYQNIDNNYANSYYLALSIDAESVNGSIPSIAILTKGLIVKVPSNMNTQLRTFSAGIWNGTFKNDWTDDPAWCLYDFMTNTRYGMGIPESYIDPYSFYDASVYNSGQVPDGKGGYEPRFSFDAVIASSEDSFTHFKAIASNFHANILQTRGLIRLSQDRPMNPVLLVQKENVLVEVDENGNTGPYFTYSSTGLEERITSFNVTYNDRLDRNLPKVTTVEDTALINKFGRNVQDIACYGSTRESQAIRHGKWNLYTANMQVDKVLFKMGSQAMGLEPGDIVRVWDEDYTAKKGSGRIVSSDGTNIVLDQAIQFTRGSIFYGMLADGKTIGKSSIDTLDSTTNTIQINPALNLAEQAEFFIVGNVSDRQFKILGISQEQDEYNIEAVFHDPNKFNYIEFGVALPTPLFSESVSSICSAPLLPTARAYVIMDNDIPNRQILVSWVPPSKGKAASYTVAYRRKSLGTNAGYSDWQYIETQSTSVDIPGVVLGTYEFSISAVSVFGIPGPAAYVNVTIDLTGGSASPLFAPTNVREASTGSTSTFTGTAINVAFTNDPRNNSIGGVAVRDFLVKVINPNTLAVRRTFYVPAVPVGGNQNFTYTFAQNQADGLLRSVRFEVLVRDTNNNLSASSFVVLTNQAPAFVQNFAVTAGIGNVKLNWTRPADPDFAGILVWKSITQVFTPDPTNLFFQGDTTYISDTAVNPGTVYYYKIAAYDDFGFAANASDLNVSAAQGAVPLKQPGVPGGTQFPATPAAGDTFFRTDTNTLYSFYQGQWQAAGIQRGNDVPTTGGTLGDTFLRTSDQVLFVLRQDGWQPVTVADGSITAFKIATDSIDASKIKAGSIDGTRITASSITGGLILANSVNAAAITAGTITGDRIAANTIITDNLAAGAVTAEKIRANAIYAVHIVAGQVTADKINVGSLSAISANIGNIGAGIINLLNGDGAGGYGYIRNANKWYRDGTNGFILANHPNGENFFSLDCAGAHIWAHSSGDFGIQGPGFLLTNGGLTINQLDVIGEANIRQANITTLKLAGGAATAITGAYTDGRQLGDGWNTYSQVGLYAPYGGSISVFISGMVQPPVQQIENGAESGSVSYVTEPVHCRVLINGNQHIYYENIAQAGVIGTVTNWSSIFAFPAGADYFTIAVQYYFNGATGWEGRTGRFGYFPGVYKAATVAILSAR